MTAIAPTASPDDDSRAAARASNRVASITVIWAMTWAAFGLICTLIATPVFRLGPEMAPVHLNWVAVGGGTVAALSALATFQRLRPRSPRVLVMAALIGALVVCLAAAFGLLLELVALAFSQAADSWSSVAGQLLAATGAVLLISTIRTFRQGTSGLCPRCGRSHGAAASPSGADSIRAPRRVRLVAYIGAVAFIPYVVMKTTWAVGGRFAGVTGEHIMAGPDGQNVSELWSALMSWGIDPTALMALLGVVLLMGLVHPWGRRIPAWMPVLGRRTVPRWLLLAPAGIGAATLVPYGLFGVGYVALGSAGVITIPPGDFPTSENALLVMWFGLGPFCLFGIALAVATWSYLVRTRPRCSDSGLPERGAGPSARMVPDKLGYAKPSMTRDH